jgi:hypothetical protein
MGGPAAACLTKHMYANQRTRSDISVLGGMNFFSNVSPPIPFFFYTSKTSATQMGRVTMREK